jgi:hypothetical protein
MNEIRPDIIADVTSYPTERGGRHSATRENWFGCPCTVSGGTHDLWDCKLFYEAPIEPGETRRVAVVFLSKEAIPIFQSAAHFYLWDGRIIAEATVVSNAENTNSNGASQPA